MEKKLLCDFRYVLGNNPLTEEGEIRTSALLSKCEGVLISRETSRGLP